MKILDNSNYSFHKIWLNHVKESIGATYLSYENDRGYYSLKAMIKGKEVRVHLEGTPSDVTVDSYKTLINNFLGLENE